MPMSDFPCDWYDDTARRIVHRELRRRFQLKDPEEPTQQGIANITEKVEAGEYLREDFPSRAAFLGCWITASRRVACRLAERNSRYTPIDDGLLEILGDGEDRAPSNEWLNEVLDQLSPQDREILWLRYVEGLTLQEISERLGISISAVRSRLARALRSLHPMIR